MNTKHHTDGHIDPLPNNYDSDLRHIDALLHQQAGRQSPPAGLADRMFHSSVRQLAAHRPASLEFTAPKAVIRPIASRLAMAAAVGLAVMVGVLFLRSPGVSSLPGPVGEFALNGTLGSPSGDEQPRVVSTAQFSADREWLLLEAVQLSHYSDVRHLSWHDVNDDMASLVRELEM